MTGFLGGLMALSPAMGALSGVSHRPGPGRAERGCALVAAMVAACVAPAALVRGRQPSPAIRQADQRQRAAAAVRGLTMWLARLLVQIAEAALFAYLLLYFRSLDPGIG